MPIGIVIAVAVVLVVASRQSSVTLLTVSNLKKNAESKIGNAEDKAQRDYR